MARLVRAIHAQSFEDMAKVDGPHEAGHDEGW